MTSAPLVKAPREPATGADVTADGRLSLTVLVRSNDGQQQLSVAYRFRFEST